MSFTRRQLLQSTGASALLAGIGQRAFAQAGIETATIVTGFAAGGTSDTICRRVATKLSPDYARAAVVENRTGAGGQIAVSYVKGRPADGTTILQTPTSILTIYPHIYKKLPYDPMVDITPVTIGCIFDFGFAVGPAVPASVKTVPEFLAWAKANPAGANYGSPAAGSTPHFIGALLGKKGGVELKHAAYRGTQPAMLDLLGGNISAVSGPIGDITQHLPTGKVRILGVSGAKRSRFAPDVPTFGEQGIQDMAHSEWFAFFLPAKASPELVAKLNASMKNALAQKDVIDGLGTFGLEAMSSTPAELTELLKKDTAKWAPIVKEVGFTAEG
ncbi:twin-arginine translocation pathway signal protein [Variovorax paradoxus]|jgi:tripartite-type tricarboxylate transporter receptor subunit TctC|uniref:Bug family tripartite tricarboxylate transporter substrate binding protein n=1 Tax=Variovorax TaxID=34072 RepID=UPI0006E503DE|nr:Bug family tripartite tricarboxylate transporter substrate binding protein [Variovorax sp. CY25R-8]KPU97526.1 twin-arginine translocation pathway signal protein [Variovorax paradoxus]KPV06966.1 twin-arginine translocation pathway signal protein [Variovorax paradoxus]KPV07155.1 twin-arginine translocation pathway signal protein [Variovorax paradoxus]KPV20694.1 twin-arginine translocation pathway signal protein [Variovorax paradoxus]KPV31344.1 twin-arginine translocation pathway signal protei